MSYPIGIDTIFLRPTARIAHTEYCSNDALARALLTDGAGCLEDALDMDFIWSTNDGPDPWSARGRVTDMGHAEFLENGVDKREPKPCPFRDAGEVLAFDAVQEYGLPDMDALIAYYEQAYSDFQRARPNQVVTGGYYKTIVSGAIEAFGWDMLLTAAADQDGFERVLDSIFRLSLHHYEAWAKTSIEAFISHDDMVWTEGPFMDPAFYRRVIFPRYRRLWKVLKEAGKKVLFCSDGDFTMFVDDLADVGADGFIFEPLTSLERVVEGYGKTHMIGGSCVDCRTLTFGTQSEIQAEVDATLRLARDCKGFMCAVGNHIPSNVPVDHALFYLSYLKQHWNR
ncbi:MAG: hypothetical protein NTU83_10195 [Candidatus Hydrogenedentes bacterium]|nr:hypothetical protein [Candidatus Hydrogenedentota bacterium]